jgi:hypothetical protein
MNQKLQQAIQATRAGENKKAQYLLTQTLQEEPDNSQAWYLLSLLVDSEEKQAIYLQRVVALEPTHEKAQARLHVLATAVPIVEAVTPPTALPVGAASDSDYSVFSAAPDEAGDLPDWMKESAGDETAVDDDMLRTIDDLLLVTPETSAGIPDWLQEDALGEWLEEGEESGATAVAYTPETAPAITPSELAIAQEASPSQLPVPIAKKPATPAKKDDSTLTAVLIILTVLAVVIALILVYMLLNL